MTLHPLPIASKWGRHRDYQSASKIFHEANRDTDAKSDVFRALGLRQGTSLHPMGRLTAKSDGERPELSAGKGFLAKN